jgi:hypothetical protein
MDKMSEGRPKSHSYEHAPVVDEEEAEHERGLYVHEQQRLGLGGGVGDDDEYVLELHHEKRHVSSAKSATFNLVNNIIGGGVLV